MPEASVQCDRHEFVPRLRNAVAGGVLGLGLVVFAIVQLYFNEDFVISRAKRLSEGQSLVLSIDASKVDQRNVGKLVHVVGDATGQVLADPLFHVSATAIHLRRVSSMYQWTSATSFTHQGSDSHPVTHYFPVWRETLIDSSKFGSPDSHQNPTSKRLKGQKWEVSEVHVGAFTLEPRFFWQINNYTRSPLTQANRAQLPADLQHDAVIWHGQLYLGGTPGTVADPENPRIGDLKIWLEVVTPGPVSVIGQQLGDTLTSYPTDSGDIDLLYVGRHRASEMLATEQHDNLHSGWTERFFCLLFAWMGLGLAGFPLWALLRPAQTPAKVLGTGLGMTSLLVAIAASSVTIAADWLDYFPLLAVPLLVVAAGCVAWLLVRWRWKDQMTSGGEG